MASPVDVAKTLKPEKKEKKEKKPYIRKPHLTDKPFQDNEALRKLQKDLNARKNHPAGKGRKK